MTLLAVAGKAESEVVRSFTLDEVDEIMLDVEYIREVLQLLIQVNDQATNPTAAPTCAITCEALDRIVRISETFNGKEPDAEA